MFRHRTHLFFDAGLPGRLPNPPSFLIHLQFKYRQICHRSEAMTQVWDCSLDKLASVAPGTCSSDPPEKMGLIIIFLGILLPQVGHVTLTYTQISAVLAIYSAAAAAASISDTGFTMIYEPAHWPSLFWEEKRGHIPSYMPNIHPIKLARRSFGAHERRNEIKKQTLKPLW